MWYCCIFVFKQKTAYEMRISDWSSDVCSSDLGPAGEVAPGAQPLCRGDQLRVRFAEHLATRDAADLAEDEGAAGCVKPLGDALGQAGEDQMVDHRVLPQQPDEGEEEGGDRKSDVEGKRVEELVDLGGRPITKKK